MHESKEGWTDGVEDVGGPDAPGHKIHTKAGQCQTLSACNWKDLIIEGRTITVFDPTREAASITIDNPKVSDSHIATLLGIFIKYKNSLAITIRMTGPIRNFSFKIPPKNN